MAGSLPFAVPATALDYFHSLVVDDTTFSLTETAVSIAQDDFPQLDTQGVLAEIDTLIDRLKRRIPADAAAAQRLRLLNRYFFEELGFRGNVNDYYDPCNSYVHEVLSSRRGIPITLAVLYIEFAGQIGLTARGVSFPGHFLVKLRMPQGEVVIDPFTGHSLSRDELDGRLAPYRRSRGLQGDFEAPLGLFLQAAPPRDVIARMLRNLKEIHRSSGELLRLLAVQQRLLILLPDVWEEVRDRGLMYADLGAEDAAASDLEDYLLHVPDSPDRAAISARLANLKGGSAAARH